MPVPATRDEFLDLVRLSGVIDEARVAAFQRSAAEAGVPLDQPLAVAQRMIREGLLTPFQAKQLLQGKFRRFLISGKYKLLEMLGTGGMGQVFLCSHIYMHRLVALKVLPVDKLKDLGMKERFYQEARAAGALDHPNIVRAYDIDRDLFGQDELHYIVMEFVDGASLQELVARGGPFAPMRAAHYIKQAALGLQHAHEAGLVHRDIKPGNLLLDRSGTVKVLDLGLARFFQSDKDNNLTERFDEKNAVLGTADYLAPEQARGDKVDIRADIYSLGSTFYFLLCGHSPFEEGNIGQKLLWVQTKAPKPLRDWQPDLPAELAAVIDRMMAKDPKDRFPTPQALVEALAPWTSTPIPPPAADEMPRRSPAVSAPASQISGSMVPSTPLPRSVPSDLIRARPAASAAAKSAGPAAPVAKPAPRTPAPAGGPKSRRFAPIIRGPAPQSAVRRKPVAKPTGPSVGTILAVAGGGGAALVVLGIVLAWLIVGRKSHSSEHVDHGLPVPPVTAPAPTAPIPPEQAETHYNQQRTVEMTVMTTGKAVTAERYFLNSKDRGAPGNFTVTFTRSVFEQLGVKSVADLDAKFKNKRIRVTGTITKYNERPQIEVSTAKQIEIVN
jgi:serine/threonine protein kinase